MAETIDLVRDSTMQGIARSVAAIAANTGGLKINSFADVQAIVRAGMADKVFAIGDQIIAEKETAITATVGNTEGTSSITAATVAADTFIAAVGTSHNGEYEFSYNGAEWHFNGEPVQLSAYGITVTGTPKAGDEVLVHETTNKLVFDIIGIDHDTPADSQFEHSLTLQLHDLYQNIQFDSTEAIYYAREELVAGTYNITLPAGYDVENGGGKTYQFTLTNLYPQRVRLCFRGHISSRRQLQRFRRMLMLMLVRLLKLYLFRRAQRERRSEWQTAPCQTSITFIVLAMALTTGLRVISE